MTGVVKFYKADSGYGFIMPVDGGEDVFFHQSSLADPKYVQAGCEVEFELFPLFPKPRALSVRLLSKRTYAPAVQRKEAYGTD